MRLPFPILTAEEAASLIQDGQTIGFSGFTPAGSAKAIPAALAVRAKIEHAAGRPFKVGVLTGASTGKSLDGALAEAEAISFRTPYQSDSTLRKQINSGQVKFVDMHLSLLPQIVRYGFLGPVHWAVVEACDIMPGGGIVLSTAVGASNTYLRLAEKILIELNAKHPATLLGMHDIFDPGDQGGTTRTAVLVPGLGHAPPVPAQWGYAQHRLDGVPLVRGTACSIPELSLSYPISFCRETPQPSVRDLDFDLDVDFNVDMHG